MWKDLKVTLYDIFGYLLPGSVALGALHLCLTGLAGHTKLGDLYLSWGVWVLYLSWEVWVLLGLIAYYLGHVVQGIGNGFEWLIGAKGGAGEVILGKAREAGKRERFRKLIVGKHWVPIDPNLRQETEDRINARVAKIFQPSMPTTNDTKDDESYKWLYDCCAEVIAQYGLGEQREMYEYREGFYRGSAIAFVLLAGSILTVLHCPANLSSGLSVITLLSAAFCSLLAAFLCFRRYGRFSASRVKRTLLGFLVLDKELQRKQEELQRKQGQVGGE